MSSISLVISSLGVESMEGKLEPEMDARVDAYRLVHEQQDCRSDVRWFFFARCELSKPEAMRRALQWYDSVRHRDWPGFER